MTNQLKTPQTVKKAQSISAKRMDRCFRIFELRKNGGSFRGISNLLKKEALSAGGSTRGLSHTQIKADFTLAIELKSEGLGDAITEARVLTSERLDDIYIKIAPLLMHEKPKIRIAAANVLIRANREYAELFGAKKPMPIEIFSPNGQPLIPKDLSITIESIYGSEKPRIPEQSDVTEANEIM